MADLSFKKPDYPDILLAKTWDSKKSMTAKVKVKKTGITEALTEAKKAYDGVDWPKLEAFNSRPNYKDFHVQAYAQALNDAKSEATGSLRKFQMALDGARDAADKAEKRLAEHKLKDDVKLVQGISAAADELGGRMHANVVLPVLISLHRDQLAKLSEGFASFRKDIQNNVALVLKAMVAVKEANFDPVVFSSKVSEVRKVAQQLGNVRGHLERGFELGGITAQQADALYNEMLEWRNGKPEFPPGTPAQTVALEVYKVRESMTRTVKSFV